MSFAKFFYGALETVTGIVRRSSSLDRTIKGVVDSVKESDSFRILKEIDATIGSRSSSIMHKLESGRPHSAGPLYRRNGTEQMRRIGETRRGNPNASSVTDVINPVLAGGSKSTSILYAVEKWLEGNNVQHPAPILKKSSGKPVKIKMPLIGYQSLEESGSFASPYIQQIRRHLRTFFFHKFTRNMDCLANKRRFRLVRRCKRKSPPLNDAEAVFHLLTKAQKLTRSVKNKCNATLITLSKPRSTRLNSEINLMMTLKPPIKTPSSLIINDLPLDISTRPVQMEFLSERFPQLRKTQQALDLTQSVKNKSNPALITTLPKYILTNTPKNSEITLMGELNPAIKNVSVVIEKDLLSNLKIRPAQMESLPTKISLLPKSKTSVFQDQNIILLENNRNIEKFKKEFYSHPISLTLPLPPTHKERLTDILRQYQEAIRNFELPSHSEITASLNPSQKRIETELEKNYTWHKEMGHKQNVLVFQKQPDLITVIGHQPPSENTNRPLERKRLPIITVPVTVVDVPKDDDESRSGRGGSLK